MFTGIIADVAQIVAVAPLGADSSFSGVRVTVQTEHLDLSDVALGDSIAINGACMTVVTLDQDAKTFAVDVSHESLSKTSEAVLGFVGADEFVKWVKEPMQ